MSDHDHGMCGGADAGCVLCCREALGFVEESPAEFAAGVALNSMAHPVGKPVSEEADLDPATIVWSDDASWEDAADRVMAAGFRDAVIAGLRERGWPEPRWQEPNGEFIVSCWVWGEARYPVVWIDHTCLVIGYEAPDDQESAHIEFDEGVSPARVVEALDRLRWVIGLPRYPVRMSKEAYEARVAAGYQRIASQWEDVFGTAAMGTTTGGPTVTPEQREAFARGVGRQADEAEGRRPLPSKPNPKPERPYVPRKIGEF